MDLDKLAQELSAQRHGRTHSKRATSSSSKSLAYNAQVSAFQYADPYNLLAHTEEHTQRQDETAVQKPSKQRGAEDSLPDENDDRNTDDWRHVDLEGLELLAEQIRNVLLGEGQLTDDGGDANDAPSRIRSRYVDPPRSQIQIPKTTLKENQLLCVCLCVCVCLFYVHT
jgi:hypothetical protein